MILLDTNVISAMTSSFPDQTLTEWFNLQTERDVWTTSVTVFEIEAGIAVMPEGRRRSALRAAWNAVLREDLGGRVVPFDEDAARSAALLVGERRKAGVTVEIRDTQIAGITLSRHATLATRNIRHFRDLNTQVVDPWATRE